MSSYGYKLAMETAGAVVHEFATFGSYQGDWWALVTFEGSRGWVNGGYGSCSGCDAWEAEIDVSHYTGPGKYEGTYHSGYDGPVEGCSRCEDGKVQVSAFGRGYLSGMMSQEEAVAQASRNLEWDSDAVRMVDFVSSNKA